MGSTVDSHIRALACSLMGARCGRLGPSGLNMEASFAELCGGCPELLHAFFYEVERLIAESDQLHSIIPPFDTVVRSLLWRNTCDSAWGGRSTGS